MSSDSSPTSEPLRAVVTGAAGFIGSHLVASIVTGGGEVVGLDNERSGDWARVEVDCTRVQHDLAAMRFDDLVDVCRGADVLFHLAAEKYNSSKSSPEQVLDVNVVATDRLYRAAAAAGVRKVVFTSSLYAYGSLGPEAMRETQPPTPTTTYGASKVMGEHLLRVLERDHGTAWSVARLFFVYGPRQYAEGGYKSVILSNFERLLEGKRPTIYGDGGQQLDYVFVDDVVRALRALVASDQDGRTYNVGSGHGTSVNELTARMMTIADRKLEPEYCPPDWTAGSIRVGDPTAAQVGLGWSATTTLNEGLACVWNWMVRSHG